MIDVCLNCGTHDASVTILEHNKILAHLIEERLTNIKHNGSPVLCLEKIKDYVNEIDNVYYHHLMVRHFDPISHIRFLQFRGGFSNQTCENIERGSVIFEHHKLHAVCGAIFSGFEDAVILVLDGAGHTHSYGKENMTIYDFNKNKINILYQSICGDGSAVVNETGDKIPDYVDPFTNIGAGYCYTAITQNCGFEALDCGKTMGLAPYGEEDSRIPTLLHPNQTCGNHSFTLGQNSRFPWMGDTWAIINDWLIFEDRSKWGDKLNKVTSLTKSDVEMDMKNVFKNLAYRIQEDYENYLIATCKRALSISNSKNLVITGGCALNCVANYKLLKYLPDDINLFIDPVPGDSGVSIGGVAYNKDYRNIDIGIYLGSQLQYEYDLKGNDELDFDASSEDVAKLLTEGNIVAIAQGRSEIGPRALGNRSILFDPRVKNGKDIVNTVKKREFFRPFAGTVLLEHARDWFDMDRLEESPFMSYAIDVLPEKQDLIPSIVHFGTCRIQTVTREQNKHYYDLISEFYKQTDVPILFNTSFNLAGDTITETIDDCLGTLRNSLIEYLYLPEINKLVYIPNK